MNLFLEKIRGDKIIWTIVSLLAFFSFLPVYSASSNFGNDLCFIKYIKHFVNYYWNFNNVRTHLIPYNTLKDFNVCITFIITILFFTALQGNVIDGANASRWIKLPLLVDLFNPHQWLSCNLDGVCVILSF